MSDPTNPYGGQQPNPYGQQPNPYGGQQPNPYGGQPTNPYGEQQPTNPYGEQPTEPDWPAADPGKRPGVVTAAGVLAIIGSVLGLLLGLFALAAVFLARDDLREEIERELAANPDLEGIGAEAIFAVLVVLVGVLIFWCLVAILLAILTLRGSNVARIMLIISSVMTALLSLATVISGFTALSLGLGIAVTAMLLTGGARDWFKRSTQQPPSATTPH